MKKEIPILFNTDMLSAILDGRKTMTRRGSGLKEINKSPDSWSWGDAHGGAAPYNMYVDAHGLWFVFWNAGTAKYIKCPYGKPGDVLYVREKTRKYLNEQYEEVLEYATDDTTPLVMHDGDGFTMYRKDGSEKYIPWKPGIHMPKSAARIWLEVVSVRVEQLHNISHEDAVNEGIYKEWDGSHHWYRNYLRNDVKDEAYMMMNAPRSSFKTLWKSINGIESWNANPWVWVVEFKVLSTTGKPDSLKYDAVENSPVVMKPIGVMPSIIWNEHYPSATQENLKERVTSIEQACARYRKANCDIPEEWDRELMDLKTEIKFNSAKK